MAQIQFRAKVQKVFNVDDTEAYTYIDVPQFKRSHCDMPAFRNHPRFGAYANSDLFPGMLARVRRDVFDGKPLRLDRIPAGVTVDTSGFIACVSFDA